MKQKEKEKFLGYCKTHRYPRQAILFEYFLKSLFSQIEKNNKMQMTGQLFCLSSISSFHLFMYVVLMNHFEINKECSRSILTYFPQWFIDVKTGLNYYARWLLSLDLAHAPLLSFVRTNDGWCRRIKPLTADDDLSIRLSFGLPQNCDWNKDELIELMFSQDEIAEIKNDFDLSVKALLQKTENWSIEFWRNKRAFSVLGFCPFLTLSSGLFERILCSAHYWGHDFGCNQDVLLVMDKVLQSEDFINLPSQSLLVNSPECDDFIKKIMLSMQQDNALVFDNMKTNTSIYWKKAI